MTEIRRVWTYFRAGHGTYIAFFLTMTNFILIAYNFVPAIRDVLGIALFLTIFITVYVPLAVIVGYFHYKKQLPTEQALTAIRQPFRDRILGGKEVLHLEHHMHQMQIHLRGMELTNEIATKLGIDSSKLHSADEFKAIELIIQRLDLLSQHQKASEIMKNLPMDNNVDGKDDDVRIVKREER
jgi:hypothetical protein